MLQEQNRSKSKYPTHKSGITQAAWVLPPARHKDAYEKYPGTILSSHPETYQQFYVWGEVNQEGDHDLSFDWNDLKHWIVLHLHVWGGVTLEGD